MVWLALGLAVLASLIIFSWLYSLTRRLGQLQKLAEASSRSTHVGRPNDRVRDDIDGIRETLAKHRRDADSFERRLVELEQAARRSNSRPTGTSACLPAAEDALLSTRSDASTLAHANAVTEGGSVFEEGVLKAFNELASAFDGSLKDTFIEKFKPLTVTFESHQFSANESGKFWLISGEFEPQGIIVPSGKVVREWEKLYRAMNGMQAQEALGAVFDIAPGGRLRVDAAATAAGSSGAYTLARKGRLSGT